jgi:hypothetical protein
VPDEQADNVCGECDANRCPHDPDEMYVHPKGTGPKDCVRCLRAPCVEHRPADLVGGAQWCFDCGGYKGADGWKLPTRLMPPLQGD